MSELGYNRSSSTLCGVEMVHESVGPYITQKSTGEIKLSHGLSSTSPRAGVALSNAEPVQRENEPVYECRREKGVCGY